MLTPHVELPKAKLQFQKVLERSNSISKYPCSLIDGVTRKPDEEVNGETRPGVSCWSVRSIDEPLPGGVPCWRLLNSATWSVKTGVVITFEAGPAGSQTWLVSPTAFAKGTLGRWKLLARGPGIVAREKAIAKTISSLNIGVLLKFFLE